MPPRGWLPGVHSLRWRIGLIPATIWGMTVDSQQQAGKGNILVIDDDPSSLHLLELILKVDNHTVATATSLSSKTTLPFLPDVIVFNLMATHAEGIAFLSKLRSIPQTKNIKILLITSHDNPPEGDNDLEIMADASITKPINETELSKCVDDLVRARRFEETRSAAVANRMAADLPESLEDLLGGGDAIKQSVQELYGSQSGKTSTPMTCPHFGTLNFSGNIRDFPSPSNACYVLHRLKGGTRKSKKGVKIPLDHQKHYCLTPHHTSCVHYKVLTHNT